MRAPWAMLAALVALLVGELALGDLPLLGAMAAGVLAGVLAALLAPGPRSAAAQALGASGLALAALAVLTAAGPVLPGAVPPATAVVAVQAALLAGLCPLVAWLLARHAPVAWSPPRP